MAATAMGESLPSINKIKDYLIEQTNKFKADSYPQTSSYRKKLVKDRQHILSTGKFMIGVSLEPYLNLLVNPCNKHQWNILSLDAYIVVLCRRL